MTGLENDGRARAYQALHESEELHRATLSSISDAVFLADDEGTFTYICPNVDVIFGYSPDEVQAMANISRLLGENLFDPVELSAKGELRNVEREITSKSGARRIVLILLKRVSIKGGTVLFTCRDVTELRRAERELETMRHNLAHTARLALVGQLMASIMHETRQPLAAIHMNVGTAIRMLDEHDRAAELGRLRRILDDVHSGSNDAIQITERLTALVRKRQLELSPLNLNQVASNVLSIVRADAARRNIELRAELASSVPAIHGDALSLQHVILDLIVNAMEAIGDGGGERVVIVRTYAESDAVQASVSDTGPGVPPEQGNKLFEAFFTTKPEGIGLGLAIAQSIMDAHGGRIWVDENSTRGATFWLALPSRSTAVPLT